MTEQEWWSCDDAQRMLQFLRASGKATRRPCRLFACACVRRVWGLLTDEMSRTAVGVAERYADGPANGTELEHAALDAAPAYDAPPLSAYAASVAAWVTCAEDAARAPADAADQAGRAVAGNHELTPAWYTALRAEEGVQSHLLRCIFGNPFRQPPTIDPSLLTWSDGLVPKLARAVYEDRRLQAGTFDEARLAVLADALEEAGGTDEAILSHLRSDGPHVRGCWALDLVLGKG